MITILKILAYVTLAQPPVAQNWERSEDLRFCFPYDYELV